MSLACVGLESVTLEDPRTLGLSARANSSSLAQCANKNLPRKVCDYICKWARFVGTTTTHPTEDPVLDPGRFIWTGISKVPPSDFG